MPSDTIKLFDNFGFKNELAKFTGYFLGLEEFQNKKSGDPVK